MSNNLSQVSSPTTSTNGNGHPPFDPFTDQTLLYLRTMFGPAESAGIIGPGAAIVLLVRGDGKPPHLLKCCTSIAEAWETIKANRTLPLGIKTALYDATLIKARSEKLPENQRHMLVGETGEISYVVGCMLDVDAGKEGYQTREESIKAIDAMPVLPTILVSSRPLMGVHPYWIFETPIRVDSPDQVKQLNYRFWRWNKEVSIRGGGMKVDSCSGIERMLRPVGASRDNGDPVELLRCGGNLTRLESLDLPGLGGPGGSDNYDRVRGGNADGGGSVGLYLDMAGVSVDDLLVEMGCKPRGDDEWTRPQEMGEDAPTDRSGVVWPSEHTGRLGLRVYSENWRFFHNSVGQRERSWYSDAFLFVKHRFAGDWRAAARWCWRSIEYLQQPEGGEQMPDAGAVIASLAEAAGIEPPPALPDGFVVRVEKGKLYWINGIKLIHDLEKAGTANRIRKSLAEERIEVTGDDARLIVARLKHDLTGLTAAAEANRKAEFAAETAADAAEGLVRELVNVTSAEDHEIVDASIRGLCKSGSDQMFTNMVFQRNDEVVRIGLDMRIKSIDSPGLRTMISRVVRFVKTNEQGIQKCRVPDGISGQVISEASHSSLRRLDSVSDLPTLRMDGTVVQTSGYDESTGVFHHLGRWSGEMPLNPTRNDAIAAANRILGLVEEFAWIEDSMASWFAGLLTGCCRAAFAGPSPLLAVEADNAQSGKSLLVKLISIIATGNEGQTQPPIDRDDSEMRKRITGLLQAGEKIVLLDDQKTQLGGIMDTLLTSETWSDRLLGGNSIGQYPNRTLWTVTGNHIRFSGDTFRRVLLCRLDNQLRTEFKLGDLKAHFSENRAAIYTDALTVVAAFLQSGDAAGGDQVKSFEGWSKVINGAIAWTGVCGDPMWSRNSEEHVAEHDWTMTRLGLMLDGVQEMAVNAASGPRDLAEAAAKHSGDSKFSYPGPLQTSVTVKDMFFRFEGAGENEFPHFDHMIEELGCFGDKKSNLLGKILRSNKGKVCTFDGRRLVADGFGNGKRVKWLVEDPNLVFEGRDKTPHPLAG